MVKLTGVGKTLAFCGCKSNQYVNYGAENVEHPSLDCWTKQQYKLYLLHHCQRYEFNYSCLAHLTVHNELAALAQVFGQQRAFQVTAECVLRKRAKANYFNNSCLSSTFSWLIKWWNTAVERWWLKHALTWMLTNTPWYVSYSTLLPFVLRGNSKGISVFPAGTFPALATSMLLLISWIGCSWWRKLCLWQDLVSL